MRSKRIFILTLFFGLLFGLGDSQSQTSSEKIQETIDLLKNRDSDIRKKAVMELGELKDGRAVKSLIDTFQDSNANIREEASAALCKIGKPAIETLISVLRDDNDNLREGAAKTLSCMGKTSVDLLILELKNTFSSLHKEVMDVLTKMGNPAVEPLINTLINDEDTDVKLKAAEVLGRIGDVRAVDPLIAFLKYREDMFLQCSVAVALGNIKDARAVDPLIEAFKTEEGGVRLAVLDSLTKIKDKRAVAPMVDMIKKDKSIQAELVKSLANLMDSTEFEAFILANKDELNNVLDK
ncbi:MAG: HEAT repeat domain-containing protein [bacterium]|nr:HEAT repeat domain-containing protein [bacterium]